MAEEVKFSKEYYENIIKGIGEYITNHAEDYLHDFDSTRIMNIKMEVLISAGEVPTVSVKKEYFPTGVELWTNKKHKFKEK